MPAGLSKLAGAAAAAFAVERIVHYGTELFKAGTQMEILGQKAETVFGDQLGRVQEQAENACQCDGADHRAVCECSGGDWGFVDPRWVLRGEEAAGISTEMVNLSGALSEWSGGQVTATEVTNILGKAVLGGTGGAQAAGHCD